MTIEINTLSPEDMEKVINAYVENNSGYAESFHTNLFSDGIVKTIDEKQLQEWFANPEEYQKELENLSLYYYISNSSVFQLYDLATILPNLNYKITNEEKDDSYEENKLNIKKVLKKVKHKQLTRDLVSQTVAAGTLCGLWVGNKRNPYLYVFNDLEYVFPAYMQQGKWVNWVDLKWFDSMTEAQRETTFSNLSPYVTKSDYKKYKTDPEKIRYVELPVNRSVCLRTHTLFRNQRLGIPWGTQTFFDVLHKEKLKALEKSISNKVINSVAVLTLGNDKFDDSAISKKKGKTYRGVKTALQKNSKDGVTVVGIPHWSSLDFPEIKTDGLDPKKFDSINDDINSATNGVMSVINGKGNFSSGKLSLDVMYKKIAVLLEQIEEEVYQKLINFTLKKKDEDNYSVEYDKKVPLTTKEKMDVLKSLNATFGFSLKAVIDNLDGVDFEQYIEDSIYEQETLKLAKRIQPYSSSYTQNGENKGGAPEVDDVDNPSTEKTKTTDGNSNPKPSNE